MQLFTPKEEKELAAYNVRFWHTFRPLICRGCFREREVPEPGIMVAYSFSSLCAGVEYN